jgi:hypothetical protein
MFFPRIENDLEDMSRDRHCSSGKTGRLTASEGVRNVAIDVMPGMSMILKGDF